ncbi:MAG TPA: DUF177 domain-containing protein [Candidatus Pullilachnospira intestinigallinarum]|nr:DUF177 domain-containing protein [Candidatus Pullilachnospira intestinigallinarum]
MLIDLSGILAREGEQKTFSIYPEGDNFSCQLGSYAYAEKNPVELTITHTENQVVTLEGQGEISIWIPCGRCLEPVKVPFTISIDAEADIKSGTFREGGETDDDSCISGRQLDTEQLLHNEILIQWPIRVLCKEDCKGICSCCGKNLNKGTCDCDTAELDPRMAVISDIFKNFKEV